MATTPKPNFIAYVPSSLPALPLLFQQPVLLLHPPPLRPELPVPVALLEVVVAGGRDKFLQFLLSSSRVLLLRQTPQHLHQPLALEPEPVLLVKALLPMFWDSKAETGLVGGGRRGVGNLGRRRGGRDVEAEA